MVRFGLPSVLASGAAGAYGMSVFKESGLGGVWSALPSSWPQFPNSSTGRSATDNGTQALQDELRSLTASVGDLARHQRQPTVVHLGGGRGWATLAVVAAAGGGGLYVYCRVTGTTAWDLFFASRRQLEALQGKVQESMAKLWEEVQKQGEEVYKLVSSVGHKQDGLKDNQDAMRSKQEHMDQRLKRVDGACVELDAKADETLARVNVMDTRLQAVHSGVQAANQGIYMLVSAVSEVTHRIGMQQSRATQALRNYMTTNQSALEPPEGSAAATTNTTTGVRGFVNWVAGAAGQATGAGAGARVEQAASSAALAAEEDQPAAQAALAPAAAAPPPAVTVA